jgi:K+-sensing histidine kinase KdpD
MEQILVGMDIRHGAWEALARACALAERIEAHVHVLLVHPPPDAGIGGAETVWEAELRKRVEQCIQTAKADGIAIDYFITEGSYEEEIIRFVRHYRITLLVYEITNRDLRSAQQGQWSLQAIRHRIACKVEIVAPRRTPQNTRQNTRKERHGFIPSPLSAHRGQQR